MKELTRIVTVKVTMISKVADPELQFASKEETAERVKNSIEQVLFVDDIVVSEVQDFIRDVESED